MAKALGNGMPVGACWARAEVAAAFGPGDHGCTFGGQPLALAAVQATLAVMEAEDVCGRARTAGARLAEGLARLPGVVSVRGAGLLLAAQLAVPVAKEASAARARARDCSSTRYAPTPSASHRRSSCATRSSTSALRILGDVLAEIVAGDGD